MGFLPQVLCGKKHKLFSPSLVSNNFKFNAAGTKHKNFGFKETAWTLS